MFVLCTKLGWNHYKSIKNKHEHKTISLLTGQVKYFSPCWLRHHPTLFVPFKAITLALQFFLAMEKNTAEPWNGNNAQAISDCTWCIHHKHCDSDSGNTRLLSLFIWCIFSTYSLFHMLYSYLVKNIWN